MRKRNAPQNWSLTEKGLHVTTDAKSDFWQTTYYGFARDSGHFFGLARTGGCPLRVEVRGTRRTPLGGLPLWFFLFCGQRCSRRSLGGVPEGGARV